MPVAPPPFCTLVPPSAAPTATLPFPLLLPAGLDHPWQVPTNENQGIFPPVGQPRQSLLFPSFAGRRWSSWPSNHLAQVLGCHRPLTCLATPLTWRSCRPDSSVLISTSRPSQRRSGISVDFRAWFKSLLEAVCNRDSFGTGLLDNSPRATTSHPPADTTSRRFVRPFCFNR